MDISKLRRELDLLDKLDWDSVEYRKQSYDPNKKVPDEDLYEQGQFPSTYNVDHKWTFTILKTTSWSPCSLNLAKWNARSNPLKSAAHRGGAEPSVSDLAA